MPGIQRYCNLVAATSVLGIWHISSTSKMGIPCRALYLLPIGVLCRVSWLAPPESHAWPQLQRMLKIPLLLGCALDSSPTHQELQQALERTVFKRHQAVRQYDTCLWDPNSGAWPSRRAQSPPCRSSALLQAARRGYLIGWTWIRCSHRLTSLTRSASMWRLSVPYLRLLRAFDQLLVWSSWLI